MLAPAAGAPPKTRVRGLGVLDLPRVGLPAAVFPDRRWRNCASYDDIASGSTQFLSRDLLTPQTREPYGYVHENPLNLFDPTGRNFCSAGNALFDDQQDCNPSPSSPPDEVSPGTEQCNGDPSNSGTICYKSDGRNWLEVRADNRPLFPIGNGADVSTRDVPAAAGPTLLVAVGLFTLPLAIAEAGPLFPFVATPPALSLGFGLRRLADVWQKGSCN